MVEIFKEILEEINVELEIVEVEEMEEKIIILVDLGILRCEKVVFIIWSFDE